MLALRMRHLLRNGMTFHAAGLLPEKRRHFAVIP